MWRFWPSAWRSGRTAADRQQRDLVAALQARWRSLLADALAQVMNSPVAEDDAPACLAAMTGEQLLALDQALRSTARPSGHEHAPSPSSSIPINPPESLDPACLPFVASCNANGYTRHEALLSLRHCPGRLALAAALIRTTDWVPAIQAESEALLGEFSEKLPASAWIDLLDLLVALRRRRRLRDPVWHERIMPMLHHPDVSDGRWHWASTGPRRVRLAALGLIADAEADRLDDAVRLAVTSTELHVALWGIATLARTAPGRRTELLALAGAHPAAGVRAAALRASAGVDAEAALHIVLQAIFDRSRGPRTVSADELGRRFGRSARTLWREALDDTRSPNWKGAILGLCDSPEGCDVPHIVRVVAHPSARVRSAALRGLARTGAPVLKDHLIRALTDSSRSVVQQAVQIFALSTLALEPVVLGSAIDSARGTHRIALIHANRVLGKWDALELLVRLLPDASTRSCVSVEIQRWIERSNQGFLHPAPAQLARIRAAAVRAQLLLPSKLAAPLLDILDHG